jgi:hypothetical protein
MRLLKQVNQDSMIDADFIIQELEKIKIARLTDIPDELGSIANLWFDYFNKEGWSKKQLSDAINAVIKKEKIFPSPLLINKYGLPTSSNADTPAKFSPYRKKKPQQRLWTQEEIKENLQKLYKKLGDE